MVSKFGCYRNVNDVFSYGTQMAALPYCEIAIGRTSNTHSYQTACIACYPSQNLEQYLLLISALLDVMKNVDDITYPSR